jgi:AcrR family transcriptional regulator
MRVRTDAKRGSIVEAAGEVFRERGFGGATISAVAGRFGGSKATIYRYFSSKEDLFVAAMHRAAFEQAKEVFDTLASSDDLPGTLVRFGARFLELALSDKAISIRRNSIAEGSRFGLGEFFYDGGVKAFWSRAADFLKHEMEAGRLRSADPWTAAMHLRGMLETDLTHRALIGARIDGRPRQLRRCSRKAVDAFMRAYAGDEPVASVGPVRGRTDRVIRASEGAQDMDVTDSAHAHHVGQPGPRVRLLARAGFAPQLARDFADLADAGGTDGMAHGNQSA